MKRAIISIDIDGHHFAFDVQYDDDLVKKTGPTSFEGSGPSTGFLLDLRGPGNLEALTSSPVIDEKKYKPKKKGKRLPKEDPFVLVKQGHVVRGPYKTKQGEYIWLSHPSNMKHQLQYRVGTQITREQVKELKDLAKDNEKNVTPRGGARKKIVEVPQQVATTSRKLPPNQVPEFCSICRKEDRTLGTCESDSSKHCRECCDRGNHQVE